LRLPGGYFPYGKIVAMAQKNKARRKQKTRQKRFGKLHWKLTFSYSAVTLGAVILLEALVIFGALTFLNLFFRGPLLPTAIQNTYGRQLVNSLRPYLMDGQKPQDELQYILELQSEAPGLAESSENQTRYLLVNDAGDPLAAVGIDLQRERETPADDLTVVKMDETIAEIISSGTFNHTHTYVNGFIVIGLPIINEESPASLLGVLSMATPVPSVDFGLIRRLLPLILLSLVVFSLGVALIGMVFGYFTSKGLVSRIQVLVEATDQWRGGHFEAAVHDENSDELAELGIKMNNMARQLNDLINQRKMLAVVEERNRIARDLHDSVKQKAYAAAGQISGAREALKVDPARVRNYLKQADDLLHEIRSELSLLINELRPIELRDNTLQNALGRYLKHWSERNQIQVKFVPVHGLDLGKDAETAIFRLIQEATSNIARHSRAEHALVRLTKSGSNLEIVVADDGVGFKEAVNSQGFGLTSIQERLEASHNGSVEISSQPGEGTTIRMLMNLREAQDG